MKPFQERSVDRRKYHYIYKTTCIATGKWYIGMHSTDDLQDGYIGSGKKLWQSIQKHGRDKHLCEILEFCESRSALRQREAEMVTEIQLVDPLCMNLTQGGFGGWSHINEHPMHGWQGYPCLKHRPDIQKMGIERQAFLRKTSKSYREAESLRNKERMIAYYKNHSNPFLGKEHSPESRAAISLKAKERLSKPENCSSFGRPWIFHPVLRQNKKISIEDLNEHLRQGWIKGRKMKFNAG